jgi:GT2 family glycosyltransferase
MRASPAVVVVNWNGADFLERCLGSLAAQTLPPADVVVVDNASQDGSPDLVARLFPQFTLWRLSENVGFAAGVNRGVAATDSPLVALLNSDARAEDTWLENLSRAHAASPRFSMFASRVFLEGSGGLLDTAGDGYTVAGFSFKRGWREPCSEPFLRQSEVFSPSGCAALYTRDLWGRTGGFDEGYFAFGEDVDLGFRARLLGHRCLYVPDAVVHHLYRASARRIPSLAIRHASRNEIATLVKDMPGRAIWRCLPHLLAYQLVAVASHLARGCGGPFLSGRIAALRSLPSLLAQRREIQSGTTAEWREIAGVLETRWWKAFWRLSATWRRLARVSHRAS